MANKPSHRLITRAEGETEWTELAAIWQQASGSFTGTFSKDVKAGTRVVLVDAKPKEPGPAQRRAPGAEPGQT